MFKEVYTLSGKNIIIALVIVLLVVGAIVVNLGGSNSEQQAGPIEPDREVKPQQGFTAPDFELQTSDGGSVRLYENNGKPTLVNFWASWCGPCKVEMPDLQEAYEAYGDQVNFLMVDLAFNDNMDKMKRFVEENGFTFPILLDETGDTANNYEVIAIPSTYMIDENGVIVSVFKGAMPRDYIQDMMKRLTD